MFLFLFPIFLLFQSLSSKPLPRPDFDNDGNRVVELNKNGKFKFDHFRTKDQYPNMDDDDDPQWNGNPPTGFTDPFSPDDSMPFGPQSYGLDFWFDGSYSLYGLPERAKSFNLPETPDNTEPYRLFNLDVFEYETEHPLGLYGNIPVIFSNSETSSSGVVWFTASETFVDVKKQNSDSGSFAHFFSESGVLEFSVLTGPSPAQVFSQYAHFIGTPMLPTLFSLGHHQCRWQYKTQDDILDVAENYDKYDIPVDVFWLDIGHTDGNRYFTWNERSFPDPVLMQQTISSTMRKMITIVDPHLKSDDNYYVFSEAKEQGHLVLNKNKDLYLGNCWPGQSGYFDSLSPKAREWWASLFDLNKYQKSTLDLYTWNDMNEPSVFSGPEISMPRDNIHWGGVEHRDVHNIYGSLVQKATAVGQVQRHSSKNFRPFVLTRAFFFGSARTGGAWTGDNTAEYEHIQTATDMILSISAAGISQIGSDLGGFFRDTNGPLLTRFYQAGALTYGFYRNHAHIDTRRQEPWVFDDTSLKLIRKSVAQRYRALPYIYSLFAELSQNGMPVYRGMWVEFPKEIAVYDIGDQVMVGPHILVAPVSVEDQIERSVYLPSNTVWYDWNLLDPFQQHRSHRVYEGGSRGSMVSLPASITFGVPTLLRGGAIIPTQNRLRRSSSSMKNDPYTLIVALDSKNSAAGKLYSDDGLTFNHHSPAGHLVMDYQVSVISSSKSSWTGSSKSPLSIEFSAKKSSILDFGSKAYPFKLTKTNRQILDSKPFLPVNQIEQIIIVRPSEFSKIISITLDGTPLKSQVQGGIVTIYLPPEIRVTSEFTLNVSLE